MDDYRSWLFWPHNIARHVLTSNDIGYSKVESLEKVANHIQSDSDLVAIASDVFGKDNSVSMALANQISYWMHRHPLPLNAILHWMFNPMREEFPASWTRKEQQQSCCLKAPTGRLGWICWKCSITGSCWRMKSTRITCHYQRLWYILGHAAAFQAAYHRIMFL